MRPTFLISCLLALAGGLFCLPAGAADPSVSECLAASEASLKASSDHLLRAERRSLLVCAAQSCPNAVRKECMRRVEQVDAAMPTVVFAAKDENGRDLSEVQVTMDGEVLADRLDGTALAVDPGAHTFVFETAGQQPVKKELVAREAVKDRHEPIQFGVLRTPAQPAQAGRTAPDAGATQASSGGFGTQKVVAVVVAGLGAAGLITGGVFGVLAMDKKKNAEQICPTDCSNQDGVDAWSEAKFAGNISTIAFAVGGVALAGGAVLWFTAGPSDAPTEVGLGPGTVRVRGTW